MISIHKLLLVTLFCAAAQSLAQAQTNTSSSTAGATAADAGQSSTSGDIPLYQKRFTWPNLPYQADTGNGPRGTQQGWPHFSEVALVRNLHSWRICKACGSSISRCRQAA
jgi:hypothetical protein